MWGVTWALAAGGSSPGQQSWASRVLLSVCPAQAWSAGSSCTDVGNKISVRLYSATAGRGIGWCAVLLLQLRDELLFGVQLVSQAADLLLMGLSVRQDLLLHSLLNACRDITTYFHLLAKDWKLDFVFVRLVAPYLDFISRLDLILLLHGVNLFW